MSFQKLHITVAPRFTVSRLSRPTIAREEFEINQTENFRLGVSLTRYEKQK